jgi:hypothetical protein
MQCDKRMPPVRATGRKSTTRATLVAMSTRRENFEVALIGFRPEGANHMPAQGNRPLSPSGRKRKPSEGAPASLSPRLRTASGGDTETW